MSARRTLDMMVGAAVGTMLVGRGEATLAEVEQGLPEHIRAARPSHKAIAKAIVAAGWEPRRQTGGAVVYFPADALAPAGEAEPAGEGHNSVTEAQLRQFIERAERLEEERKGIADDLKDVFAEAKATGFDVKTMRAVMKLRRAEKHHRDEADALLDMYRAAMGLS